MERLAPLLGRTLVLAAHEDDESLGCGALLQRMSHPTVVFATDGAPTDPKWWQPYGSREALASTRKSEARSAVQICGIDNYEFLSERDPVFCDQELFRHLPRATELLLEISKRNQIAAVLTHAYEGGHPDHDSCSLLGYVVGRELEIPVWEMPYYNRFHSEQIVHQKFIAKSGTEKTLRPSAIELERKRAMLAAHLSQQLVIPQFDPAIEQYRPQIRYDFTKPPHIGQLNYEAWGWRMSGMEVSQAFAEFLREREQGKVRKL